jgi:hypothetical protein
MRPDADQPSNLRVSGDQPRIDRREAAVKRAVGASIAVLEP